MILGIRTHCFLKPIGKDQVTKPVRPCIRYYFGRITDYMSFPIKCASGFFEPRNSRFWICSCCVMISLILTSCDRASHKIQRGDTSEQPAVRSALAAEMHAEQAKQSAQVAESQEQKAQHSAQAAESHEQRAQQSATEAESAAAKAKQFLKEIEELRKRTGP
jgi:hypothetical protein